MSGVLFLLDSALLGAAPVYLDRNGTVAGAVRPAAALSGAARPAATFTAQPRPAGVLRGVPRPTGTVEG